MMLSLASAATALAALSSVAIAAPAPASLVERQVIPDPYPTVELFANDSRITYNGKWTHDTSSNSWSGALAYSNDPDANITIPYGFNYTGVTIIMGKKADRGYFDIALGNKFQYTADAHGDCSGNDCPENTAAFTFSRQVFLPQASADSDQLILRNSDGDSRIGDAGGTPYLAINRIYLQTEPVADYDYQY
ncbi:hypothetical protein Rhopal_000931-T1 [Rhodotorula paludigena]|uniref:Uncharacterized protein n=1 Tax=Rhodotorula paludigena TaxID=86838 RepID=A0AAV5G5Y9_9BASI|nr:hypothetical protein Rhopal_000931-T1 [Rhodotorula paludigena]